MATAAQTSRLYHAQSHCSTRRTWRVQNRVHWHEATQEEEKSNVWGLIACNLLRCIICVWSCIFILSQNIWPLPWLPYILLFALPAMLWVSHIIIHKHMCGMDAFCCPVKAMPLCCFICRDTIRVIFKFHRAKTGITYLRMIKDSLWHNNQSA